MYREVIKGDRIFPHSNQWLCFVCFSSLIEFNANSARIMIENVGSIEESLLTEGNWMWKGKVYTGKDIDPVRKWRIIPDFEKREVEKESNPTNTQASVERRTSSFNAPWYFSYCSSLAPSPLFSLLQVPNERRIPSSIPMRVNVFTLYRIRMVSIESSF